MSTAEAIAQVLGDIQASRVRPLQTATEPIWKLPIELAKIGKPTVVDATAIYRDYVTAPRSIGIYDHLLAPPWDAFAICYVNEHGNSIVMQSWALDRKQRDADEDPFRIPVWEEWETDNIADWDDVRWVINTWLWIGGYSKTRGEPFPTTGPVLLWQSAIRADGVPLDLHWVDFSQGEYPLDRWDMAQVVLLGSLNFLNCRNVEIVEPVRPRAERRRIERAGGGVKIHTINVFSAGKSYRSKKGDPVGGTPLTSVRGHVAHYGACCPTHEPRGLLFGKITGRVWVPQHARGSAEAGESQADYRLITERR